MNSKHCLFLLCFSVILFSLGHTRGSFAAANTERGRITAGINLRAAPGLAGKVITSLEAGTVVAITGEQSGWYQIAYEDETYGYRGWVYGKYIEMLSAEPGPVAPAAVAAKHPPVQTATAAPAPASFPEQQATRGDSRPLPAEMPTNTIELIQASAAPQASADSNQAPVVTAAAAKTAHPQITGPNIPAEATPAPKGPGIETPAATGKAPPTGSGPGSLLSVVLKISSVLLSCLALMISYRTFHLVTAAGSSS